MKLFDLIIMFIKFLIYDRFNFFTQQGLLRPFCNTDCVYRKLNVVQRKPQNKT